MVAYAQERDLNSLFVKLPHEDEATMFENDLKGLNYQYIFEFWGKNSLLLKFQTVTFFWQFYNFLSLIKKGFPLMFNPSLINLHCLLCGIPTFCQSNDNVKIHPTILSYCCPCFLV